MRYKIVSDLSSDGLEIKVSDLIFEGWRCTGGVVVTEEGYYQAMVRY